MRGIDLTITEEDRRPGRRKQVLRTVQVQHDQTTRWSAQVVHAGDVDVGHGWLIFALPPAELGVHPADGPTLAGTPVYMPECGITKDALDPSKDPESQKETK